MVGAAGAPARREGSGGRRPGGVLPVHDGPAGSADRQHHGAAPASEQVERDESVTDLFRALGRLSPRQREAIVLRYWLDLPLAGIATVMQVRVGTVKSLLSRGMARLAEELEDYR